MNTLTAYVYSTLILDIYRSQLAAMRTTGKRFRKRSEI